MKILVIDDHGIVREGVRRLLGTIPGSEVVEAGTAQQGLAKLRSELPDIIVLDINLNGSSGLELLQRLKNENKTTRIVMFTMYSEAGYVSRALRGGASGYVSKSAPADELVTAVKRVAAGQRYVDREAANELVFSASNEEDPLQKLSNREMEILRLLGEGKSLLEIANTFGIATNRWRIPAHVSRKSSGLNVTTDLIRFSLQNRQA